MSEDEKVGYGYDRDGTAVILLHSADRSVDLATRGYM